MHRPCVLHRLYDLTTWHQFHMNKPWISWFLRLSLCGCCRNLEIMVTVTVTHSIQILAAWLKPCHYSITFSLLFVAVKRQLPVSHNSDAQPRWSYCWKLPLLIDRSRPQPKLQDTPQRIVSMHLAYEGHDQTVEDILLTIICAQCYKELHPSW